MILQLTHTHTHTRTHLITYGHTLILPNTFSLLCTPYLSGVFFFLGADERFLPGVMPRRVHRERAPVYLRDLLPHPPGH